LKIKLARPPTTYVPGLLFMLKVGRTIDSGRKWLCIWNNPDHPITYSEKLLQNFVKAAGNTFKNARQTQSFLRAMEKIAKEKGEEI
jgi:hypothetical protein